MTQEASDECRHLVLSHDDYDNGVVRVAQLRQVEAPVASEQRRAPKASKQNDNLFIVEALPPRVNANLSDSDLPTLEQPALPLEDVLVQEIQVRTGWSMYSGATYSLE